MREAINAWDNFFKSKKKRLFECVIVSINKDTVAIKLNCSKQSAYADLKISKVKTIYKKKPFKVGSIFYWGLDTEDKEVYYLQKAKWTQKGTYEINEKAKKIKEVWDE